MRLRDTVKMKLDPSRLAGYAPEGRAQPVAVSEPRSLTASAEQIKIRNPDDVQRMRNRAYKEWQRDSWAYYDAIGEIKYGFNMFAAVLSRIRLFAAVDVDPDSVPTSTTNYRRRRNEQTEQERTDEHISEMTVPPAITDEVMEYAERLVKELFSGHGGISGFMKTFALNMSVAGECYLVKIRGKWFIRSTDEIEVDASGDIYMRTMRNGAASSSSMGGIAGDVKLPKGTPWIRIWRDHPRYSEEPDSSMLGILEPCEELITIQRMVRSIARKQMNNGILGIPEDLSVAGSTVTDDVEDAEEQADELASTIYDNFTDPVDDETASSNVVPTILVGSVEAIKGIIHIPVEKAVDDWLPNRADRALERILQGLDMPKDFVTGLANVRYTNAKNIDESLYKSHIEPMALMLCDSLQSAYFRPLLSRKFPKLTSTELDYLCVWYDPSEIVTKADPAESADKGHEKMILSDDAWRAAHGFSDADAPNEEELALRLLIKASLQPEQIAVLFSQALPAIIDAQRKGNLEKATVPMPESAQSTLFGKVIVPTDETAVNGAEPTSAQDLNPFGSTV